MIVDYALYRGGTRDESGPRNLVRIAAEARRDPDAFAWVGLHSPSEADLVGLSRIFGFHRLAVEDALKSHQRPKLEQYDSFSFMVLRTLGYDDPTSAVETGEISVFLGDCYVVTVRHGEANPLSGVRDRLEKAPDVLDHGPSAVLYAIADDVVDTYLDVASELQQDIDELETDVFSPAHSDEFERIYTLKRELQEMRRAVGPLLTVATRIVDQPTPRIPDGTRPFYRDVADHPLRVSEQVETMDNLLATILQAHVAQVGLRQNEDVRRISAYAAIFAVGTLIAGIYGMNFEVMPELGWTFGYPLALGLMAGASWLLYRAFKRSGWL